MTPTEQEILEKEFMAKETARQQWYLEHAESVFSELQHNLIEEQKRTIEKMDAFSEALEQLESQLKDFNASFQTVPKSSGESQER